MLNMNAMLLWVVLPYMSIAIFLMGIVWRYDMGHVSENHSSTKWEQVEKGSTFLVFFSGSALGLGVIFGLQTEIIQWIKGLILLAPDSEVMVNAPISQQTIAIIYFIIIGITPFSRYMSLFTLPFSEMVRIVKRNPKVTAR